MQIKFVKGEAGGTGKWHHANCPARHALVASRAVDGLSGQLKGPLGGVANFVGADDCRKPGLEGREQNANGMYVNFIQCMGIVSAAPGKGDSVFFHHVLEVGALHAHGFGRPGDVPVIAGKGVGLKVAIHPYRRRRYR